MLVAREPPDIAQMKVLSYWSACHAMPGAARPVPLDDRDDASTYRNVHREKVPSSSFLLLSTQ
jgi:hypothetical protein